MRKALLLARREFRAAVRTKGFFIGIVIAPLLMSGGAIAYWLLKDQVDITEKRVAVLDRSGAIAPAVEEAARFRNAHELVDPESGRQVLPAYRIEIVAPDSAHLQKQRLALSDRVRQGSLYAFVEIGAGAAYRDTGIRDEATREAAIREMAKHDARITFHARNAAVDDLRGWIGVPVNQRIRDLRLHQLGLDPLAARDLFMWTEVEGMDLYAADERTGDVVEAEEASPVRALAIPIGFMMLLFLMMMMTVPGMLQSVMEEKTQRIAEVLLAAIRPFEFMVGKLLGGIAVSLTIAAVYLVAATVTVFALDYAQYIPLRVLPWFFAYLLLAILLFGGVSAALGSTCSEPKDAQSLSFPSLIPALLPMFIYFPVAREPMSGFATWMSLIPPFTPTLMTLRLATPEEIPAWQPWVGLAGVLLCTLLVVWLGGRIFRIAILTQGMPPKIGNMLKWAVEGRKEIL